MGREKGTPGNYCLCMHVIKWLSLCNTRAVTNLMGWVSVMMQTYSSLRACTVPSMASASSSCGLFPDVVAANRAEQASCIVGPQE